jgi:hypothetical protein
MVVHRRQYFWPSPAGRIAGFFVMTRASCRSQGRHRTRRRRSDRNEIFSRPASRTEAVGTPSSDDEQRIGSDGSSAGSGDVQSASLLSVLSRHLGPPHIVVLGPVGVKTAAIIVRQRTQAPRQIGRTLWSPTGRELMTQRRIEPVLQLQAGRRPRRRPLPTSLGAVLATAT